MYVFERMRSLKYDDYVYVYMYVKLVILITKRLCIVYAYKL